MTIYNLSIAPSSFEKSIIAADRTFVAESGVRQIQTNSGVRWQIQMVWNNLNGTRLRDLRELHAQLAGQRNQVRVDLSTATNYTRSGSGANTPTVNGAHTTGAVSLSVDNLTLSTAGLWRGGDYITVGEQLFQIGNDYDSAGDGTDSIAIWPPLHSDLSGGESIDDSTPSGVFFLVDGSGFSLVPNGTTQLSPTVSWILEEDVTA